jgi:aryl-alcohol dehydrogenase (NADP+)
MAAWQFAEAQHVAERHGWTRFVSMQNHYNLVYREEEREMIPLCNARGVGITPWSPLARGFLAGNRSAGDVKGQRSATERARSDEYAHSLYYTEADFEVARRTESVAQRRGASPVQVALAWLLHRPGVTAPIVGATKPGQLEELAGALQLRLEASEMEELEAPYQPHRVLGH